LHQDRQIDEFGAGPNPPATSRPATMFGRPRSFNAWAAPVAIGMPAATTPLAPSMPTEKSAMCIDPPLPWL